MSAGTNVRAPLIHGFASDPFDVRDMRLRSAQIVRHEPNTVNFREDFAFSLDLPRP
jgi:hypothetical protein